MRRKSSFSDMNSDSEISIPRKRGRRPKVKDAEMNDTEIVKIPKKRGRKSKKELEAIALQEAESLLSPAELFRLQRLDMIDRVCGRRPSLESSDGWEYAIKHKGVSYLHLEWITWQQLDEMELKKNVVINRFLKKLHDLPDDPPTETLLFNHEYLTVDSIIDCVDAIIEVNPSLYLTGWRLLNPTEELDKKQKIYNLPQSWRKRLGSDDKKKSDDTDMMSELAGENPYIHLKKNISSFYPEDESVIIPTSDGSVFYYERIYLVKWVDMSIAEATWERSCDIQDDVKIQQYTDYNTIPDSILAVYGDYLPENYLSLNDVESTADVTLEVSSLQAMPPEGKKRRGRPRKSEIQPRRRNRTLRFCVDPNPPQISRDAKDNGYKPPLSGIWRRILNIVMVLTNCTQTEIAAFCGFAQSSLSLWVNGKYAGDTRMLLGKLRDWVEATYPELGVIAKKHPHLADFQKACYPYLSRYVKTHPETLLTEADVRHLLGFNEDGTAVLSTESESKPVATTNTEADLGIYNADPLVRSDKVYVTDYDWETEVDYVKSYGPVGTCCLMTEVSAQSLEQDRTVVFQSLDKPVLGSLQLLSELDQPREKAKKYQPLPPVIAAPLEGSADMAYVQPVSMKDVETVRESGSDVSVLLNDVMKTVIYEDHEIDPEGYQLRNRVVGVMDNTFDTYNAVRTHAASLRGNNRSELLSSNVLSLFPVNLTSLNSKLSFSFSPGAAQIGGVIAESSEARDETKEMEEESKEGLIVESTLISESVPSKVSASVPTPTSNPGMMISSKMITYNRSRYKAYQESAKRKSVTVDDLLQILFKPSRLNPPIALLPPLPTNPMQDTFEPYTDSPVYHHGLQLREYQVVSLNWMIQKWRNGEGMILGDEMGLGKTIQVISLLHHFITKELQEGPYLVIAPLSTLKNWAREFYTWTKLRVCLYHSEGKGKDERQLIRRYNWFFKGLPVKNLFKFNVLLTTYEVIMKDWSSLGEIAWTGVVMDEAHRMRNNNCKFIQFISNIRTQHKLLLTGTPLQNNTGELWPLLNFIDVTEAGSLERFKEEFGDLRSSEQVERLRALLSKCMLRRVKEEVEKSIPRKQETIVEVELTITQKQYYKAMYDKNRSFLYKGCKRADIPSLMHVETQLRKVCNHPFLIKGVREKEESLIREAAAGNMELYQDGSLESLAQQQRVSSVPPIVSCSGKMVLLDKLLPKLQSEGHRVLIFSQFVKMLDILEEYCQLRQYKVARIDGQTRGSERQEAIDAFSRPDSDYFIFLLSTRAGGLGINLTAADTVIIYDSDWNPQNDSQATARCHRIGQKQEVSVYRLLTRHTYEYEMFERASRKLAIETVVLDRDAISTRSSATVNAVASTIQTNPNEMPLTLLESVETPKDMDTPGGPGEPSPITEEMPAAPVGSPRESIDIPVSEANEMEVEANGPLEDLPESDSETKKSDWSSDEEFVMTEDEGDEESVITKTTQDDVSVNGKLIDEYGVPAVPIVPIKKKRGRKPTKPRTLEDELNPYRRSKNEVEEMLRRGLFDCIMDSSVATSLEFFDADIDSILQKNTRPEGSIGTRPEGSQSVVGVERGGTIYSKRSFTPETASAQIDLNDPDFWEKMLQHANADMLLQRLQDPAVMQDAASVSQWLKDLEGLVRELSDTIEADGESGFNQHELDTTTQILMKASSMTTVFGKKACNMMMNWLEELEQGRFRRRTQKKQEDPIIVTAKSTEPISGICCVCLTGEDKENGLTLISCSGRCCRQFHLRCIKLRHIPSKWKCKQCSTHTFECMICHQMGKEGDTLGKGRKRLFSFYEQWLRYNDIESYINLFGSGGIIDPDRNKYMVPEPVVKCTQHHCGCFYHLSCAKKSPNFVFYDQHPCLFRCPRHYCCMCGNNQNSQFLAVCARCPHAYHANCLKQVSHQVLNKKYVLCEDHPDEHPHLPDTPAAVKRESDISEKSSKRVKVEEHLQVADSGIESTEDGDVEL